MKEYQNIQDGAFGMLYESTNILNSLDVKYIVVGGWSPYLLNSNPIPHPGTNDVDVLFDKGYEKGKLKEIIAALLDSGFILSAKHDFQLFKEINVKGKTFIYNLDLLHPLETVNPTDIYVEHIEFDIPADKYLSKNFKMKSIALPNSQVLFDNKVYQSYSLEVDGLKKIEFPLMSELGTLLTKSKSVLIEKRYRDSLDIFLTISQSQNYNQLIKEIRKLKIKSPDSFNVLYGVRQAFEEVKLYINTIRFINIKKPDFDYTVELFLKETGLNELANH